MAVPVTRLTNTGTLYTVGQFDEATLDLTSGYQKNLFKSSNDLTSVANWNVGSSISNVLTGQLAPDGTYTAFKVIESTTGGGGNGHYLQQGVSGVLAGQVVTISFYAKSAERYVVAIEVVWAPGGSNGISMAFNLATGTAIAQQPYGSGATGTAGTSTMTPVGNGWYYCTANFTNLNDFFGTSSYIRWPEIWNSPGNSSYNGDGVSGLYVWHPQFELGANATEYEPTGATAFVAVPQGFTTRTDATGVYTIGSFDEVAINPNSGTTVNLATYSQQFTNPVWNNITRAEIGATNYIAPDGTATASKLIDIPGNTSTGYLRRYYPFQNNVTYTYSVYGKAQEISNLVILNFTDSNAFFGDYVNFNLLTGTVASNSAPTRMINPTIIPVGNGWYRCSVAQTVGGTSYGLYSGPANGGIIAVAPSIDSYSGSSEHGDGVSGILIWGVQVEVGTTATNYIPMTSVPSAPFVQRIDNTGLHRIAGQYDEVTGIVATTNGLAMNIDFAFPQCYPGSGYIVTDMTGNGVNFTYNNQANQFPLYDGTSFYFNGINFQALCTNTISYPAIETQAFSIEVWINPTILNTQQTGGDGNIIAIRENYAVSGFRFGLETPNGLTTDTTAGPVFFCGESGGTLTIRTSTNSSYPISLGKWAQVVVTYDGISTANMYVNGAFAISAQGGYRPPTRATGVSNYFFIGGPEEGTRPMNGKIGVVRWYNRPLLASEVADNFNGLRHRYGL